MMPVSRRAPRGFTLLEILVALVLIGLLAGAIVPSVLNQLGKGDVNRAVEDIVAIEDAAKSFRVDVRRWPGDIEDLVAQPVVAADSSLTGPYPSGLLGRWNGPYLERVNPVGTSGDVTLPLGGTVLGRFATDSSRVVIQVTGLTDDQVNAIDAAMDGTSSLTAGRVRTSGSPGAYTLRYIAGPAR